MAACVLIESKCMAVVREYHYPKGEEENWDDGTVA
jgi:hypothetical protein